MNNFKYTSENEIKFQEYVSRYPKIDSCMLPALWLVQEQEGWVSPEAMVYVADRLGKTPIQVYEVATFYTMFNLKPIGKYHIELCKTVSCMVCGAKELKQYIKDVLGLESGQTSADGLFTFTEVECQGANAANTTLDTNTIYQEAAQKIKDEALFTSDDKHLLRGCIDGMVHSVDKYGRYINEEEYETLYLNSKPVAGVGLFLTQKQNRIYIKGVVDDSSAQKAALQKGVS